MTGWRLGYGITPRELSPYTTLLMTNSNSCTAAFTQIAGIEALTGPQNKSHKMIEAFRQRRDVIVKGLNEVPGFNCLSPKGAFYVFPNIEGTGKTSKFLQGYSLEEAGVATLSGTSFGKYGEGFLRLSYANSVENIRVWLKTVGRVVSGGVDGRFAPVHTPHPH